MDQHPIGGGGRSCFILQKLGVKWWPCGRHVWDFTLLYLSDMQPDLTVNLTLPPRATIRGKSSRPYSLLVPY